MFFSKRPSTRVLQACFGPQRHGYNNQGTRPVDPFRIGGLSSGDEGRGGDGSGSESSGSLPSARSLTARPTGPRAVSSAAMSPIRSVPTQSSCRVERRSLARCRSSPQSPSSVDAPLCVDDCFGMDCFGVDDRSEMEWAATDQSSQGGASEGLDLPHVVDLPAAKHTPEDPAWGMDADAVHGPDETAPESCRRPDTESRCLPRLRTASAHANRVRWLFLLRRCGVPEGFIASLWLLR